MRSGYTSARMPPRTFFPLVFHGTDRHADHRPLDRSDRAGRPRARRSRGRDPSRTGRCGAADTRGAGAIRGRGAHRAAGARAAARLRQRTHAGRHDPAAGRGGKLFFRLLAESPDPTAGAALDGCGVRPRRHRAGDRRHAHQRHDLLRRHAPVPGSRRRRQPRRRRSAPASACPSRTRRARGPAPPTNAWRRGSPCTTSIATIR